MYLAFHELFHVLFHFILLIDLQVDYYNPKIKNEDPKVSEVNGLRFHS